MNDDNFDIGDTIIYSFGHSLRWAKVVGVTITTEILSGKLTHVYTSRTYTIQNLDDQGIRSDYTYENFKAAAKKHLEILRKVLHQENISYAELGELQVLARFIEPGDVELLEAAGIKD